MSWEIIVITVIAAVTVVWFLISDRRARASDLNHRAMHFATSPAYRHRANTGAVPAARPLVPVGLSPSDRMFLEALAKRGQDSKD